MRLTLSRAALITATVCAALTLDATAAMATGVSAADTSAVGTITLCNAQGQQVTSGSLAAKPFVWRAVDSTPAPKDYGAGGTATLFGFQPRPGVAPGDWSGEQLTASAKYTDPSHPMAAATTVDESLATYLGDYPLSATGQVQLRIYLGAPNQPPYSFTYDAADIQVSNGSWRQLNPGSASCGSGKALSIESVALPKKDFKVTPRPQADQSPAKGSAPDTGSGAPATTASPTPGAASSDGSGTTDASPAADASHSGRNIVIVVILAAIVGLSGAMALRHRS